MLTRHVIVTLLRLLKQSAVLKQTTHMHWQCTNFEFRSLYEQCFTLHKDN